MAGITTYALVADSYVGQFIITKGNPYEMEKAYKVWFKKLFKKSFFGRKKIIELPTENNLPAVFTQETFLGLSIVEIPVQHDQNSNDPRMSNFISESSKMGEQISSEKLGVDMLDQGMTR